MAGVVDVGRMVGALAVVSLWVAPPTEGQTGIGRPDPSDVGSIQAGVVIQERNIVLDRAADGGWRVTDFVLARMPDAGVAGRWEVGFRYPLPEGIRDARLVTRGSESAPGFVAGGVIRSEGALHPGETLFVTRYGATDPFLTVRLPGYHEFVEVLIREPAPLLEVLGLRLVGTTKLDDSGAFLRYTGVGVQNTTLSFRPGPEPATLPVGAAAAGVAVILVLGGTLACCARGTSGSPCIDNESRRRIVRDIARIDETLDAAESLEPEEREALLARRVGLFRRAGRPGRWGIGHGGHVVPARSSTYPEPRGLRTKEA
jgi:hypothetical protein